MTVRFGDITFDHIRYDPEWDSLILHVGPVRPGDDWDESEEGDALRFKDGQLIGVEVFDARYRLDRGEQITVTMEDGSVLHSPDVHLAIRRQAA